MNFVWRNRAYAIVLVLCAFAGLSYFFFSLYHQRSNATESHISAEQAVDQFERLAAVRARELHDLVYLIESTDSIRRAFQAGDRGQLYSLAEPILLRLSERDVTHFYFTDAKRQSFLRVHRPGDYGDLIDRATTKKAAKSLVSTSAIEVGPFGEAVLRAVSPWLDKGKLIGFIELGIDLEALLNEFEKSGGGDISVLLDPAAFGGMLDGEELWGAASHAHGLRGSQEQIIRAIRQFEETGAHSGSVALGGREVWLDWFPFADAAGEQRGWILLPNDLSAQRGRVVGLLARAIFAAILLIVPFIVVIGFIVVNTERNARENEKLKERQFHLLSQQSLDTICVVDASGIIKSDSESVTRIFGFAPNQRIGTRFLDYVYAEDRSFVESELEEIVSKQIRSISFEYRTISSRGHPQWTYASAADFIDDPLINGVILTARDCTEERAARGELKKAKDEALEHSQAKSNFLAKMSHEFRTPLNAIIGFSETIKEEIFGPVDNPRYRAYSEDIFNSGHHLLSLVNDVLDLSKIEVGEAKLHETIVDPVVLVNSIVPIIRVAAEGKGVSLKVDLADDLLSLHADERRLKQVLLNLLSNAVKYTPSGGSVTLKVWCAVRSGHVFQVEDNGIGIAPENIAVALASFGQVESALDDMQQGTGLGLPITKSLVELHAGSFDLESTEGVGTIATVRLPAFRIAHPSAGSAQIA